MAAVHGREIGRVRWRHAPGFAVVVPRRLWAASNPGATAAARRAGGAGDPTPGRRWTHGWPGGPAGRACGHAPRRRGGRGTSWALDGRGGDLGPASAASWACGAGSAGGVRPNGATDRRLGGSGDTPAVLRSRTVQSASGVPSGRVPAAAGRTRWGRPAGPYTVPGTSARASYLAGGVGSGRKRPGPGRGDGGRAWDGQVAAPGGKAPLPGSMLGHLPGRALLVVWPRHTLPARARPAARTLRHHAH